MCFRFLFAAVLLCFACLAHADEASHKKAIDELILTMHGEKLIDEVREVVLAQVAAEQTAAQAKLSGLNQAQKETVQRYAKKQLSVLGEVMSWPNMEAFLSAYYARTYSEAEIVEMNTFFKSPLGQKIIKCEPELMAEAMKAGQGWVQAQMPRLDELNREMVAELKRLATPAKN